MRYFLYREYEPWQVFDSSNWILDSISIFSYDDQKRMFYKMYNGARLYDPDIIQPPKTTGGMYDSRWRKYQDAPTMRRVYVPETHPAYNMILMGDIFDSCFGGPGEATIGYEKLPIAKLLKDNLPV